MIQMGKLIMAFALFALLASGFAQGPSEGLKLNVMETQYEKVACRANFYITMMNLVKDRTNVSVEDAIAAATADLDSLKTAAYAGDRAGYNAALKTLAGDLKDIVLAYKDVLKELKGTERKEIRDGFHAEKTRMTNCLQSTSASLGEAQKNYVDAWIAQAKNVSSNLKEKGVDTSKMDAVVSEAETNREELEAALGTANGTVVMETQQQIKEKHLHIWARFHIERLRAMLNALSTSAAEAGVSADVDSINALLDSAAAKVQAGKPYDEGEFAEVKGALKDAAGQMKELFKKIKGK